MKILKKISLFSFLFIIIFVLVGKINIKAIGIMEEYDYSDLVTVKGAGIRTSGNEGLRFECNTKLIPYSGYNYTRYGALIVFGTISDYGAFLTAPSYIRIYHDNGITINDHNVLNAYTTEVDSDGTYYVTIINIPENFYAQDVTILPYIIMESPSTIFSIYGDAVLIRNLGEIALAYLNDGGTKTTLLDNVINKLDNDYRKVINDNNKHMFVDSLVYESDMKYIYQEFVSDWNSDYPTKQIATTCYLSDFKNALKTSSTDVKNSDFYSFITSHNNKYFWLLNLIKYAVTNESIQSITDSLINDIDSLNLTTWDSGDEFLTCLYGILRNYDKDNIGGELGINLLEQYSISYGLSIYNNGVYTNLLDEERDIEIVKNDDAIELDELTENTDGLVYKWQSYEYKKNNITEYSSDEYYSDSKLFLTNDSYYVFCEKKYESSFLQVGNLDFETTELGILRIDDSNCYISNVTFMNGSIVLGKTVESVIFSDVDFVDCVIMKEDPGDNYIGCTIKNIFFNGCRMFNSYVLFEETDNTFNTNIAFNNCEFRIDTYDCITIANNINLTVDSCNFYTYCNRSIYLTNSENNSGVKGNCIISHNNIYCGEATSICIDKLDNNVQTLISIESNTYNSESTCSCLLYIEKATNLNNASSIEICRSYDGEVYIVNSAQRIKCTIDDKEYIVPDGGIAVSDLN